MVNKLFRHREPKPENVVLDPGCGEGAFIDGILRWCGERAITPPKIIGIESDSKLIKRCRERFGSYRNITLLQQNFLTDKNLGYYNFVIGNPPYVRIEELSEEEREVYRKTFETAVERFDLYILFFEQSLRHLTSDGRLVFITPEKFIYTWTARPLRKLMAFCHVEEIELTDEKLFKRLTTYPTITTINREGEGLTEVILRNGSSLKIELLPNGSSWLPVIFRQEDIEGQHTLEEVCDRVSCGVATGEDEVFMIPANEVPEALRSYARLTVSGKHLGRIKQGTTLDEERLTHMMLVPYDEKGELLPEDRLKEFINWLSPHETKLKARYCVKKGKEWYAFHENPPMRDMLRPKILFRDIAKEPAFWADEKGIIIPMHNVYYLVPKESNIISSLLNYLNGGEAKKWLNSHCQRAANDYLRLQSRVLKKLPIPNKIFEKCEAHDNQ
jgi:hypothetical protein